MTRRTMTGTGIIVILATLAPSLPSCATRRDEPRRKAPKVTVTSLRKATVPLIEQYVGQIQSHRRIDVRAPGAGFLEDAPAQTGQAVKQGDTLYRILPSLDGKSESGRVAITAPFDGVIGRLEQQRHARVKEGEVLTTLSDNSVMRVYFNVPEAHYLKYMTDLKENKDDLRVELMFSDGAKYREVGVIGGIEAEFNSKNGNIAFSAEFPNTEGTLRHGQKCTVLCSRLLHDAPVIPQRAAFEILYKRYVYVVGKDDVAHQREIVIQDEVDDLFIIESGLDPEDKFVLDGVREVEDGDKVEYEDRQPEQVVSRGKSVAE